MSIIVVIICDKEVMDIVSSFFYYCKTLGLFKCLNPHLNDVLKMILMVNRAYFFMLEIDDVNVGVRNIKNNNFLLVNHLKMVNDMGILVFIQKFASCIHVNDSLIISRAYYM